MHNRVFAHEHGYGDEDNLGNTNHQFPELKPLVVEGRQEAHKLVVGHVLVDKHITAPARPQHQRYAARQNNAVYDDPDDGFEMNDDLKRILAVMKDGRIVEAGPAQEVFTAPAQEYTKALFNAAL